MHRQVLRIGRRIGIAVAGGAVILAGIVLAMPLIPGPGVALIVLGIGILSLEFERPRIWMTHIKARGMQIKGWLTHVWINHIKARAVRLRNWVTRRKAPAGDGQK